MYNVEKLYVTLLRRISKTNFAESWQGNRLQPGLSHRHFYLKKILGSRGIEENRPSLGRAKASYLCFSRQKASCYVLLH